MLVGHYAPALSARRVAPEAPLWALFLAAQAVDILYFGLVFGGIEAASLHPGEVPKFEVAHGVWSHSLAMTAVYGGGALAAGRMLGWGRAGVALAAVLVSHWLLDLVVHVPDLPLALDQASAVGFGLWRMPLVAMGLEIALVAGSTAWLIARVPERPARLLRRGRRGVVGRTLTHFGSDPNRSLSRCHSEFSKVQPSEGVTGAMR